MLITGSSDVLLAYPFMLQGSGKSVRKKTKQLRITRDDSCESWQVANAHPTKIVFTVFRLLTLIIKMTPQPIPSPNTHTLSVCLSVSLSLSRSLSLTHS